MDTDRLTVTGVVIATDITMATGMVTTMVQAITTTATITTPIITDTGIPDWAEAQETEEQEPDVAARLESATSRPSAADGLKITALRQKV
jgi:hypothetical protein